MLQHLFFIVITSAIVIANPYKNVTNIKASCTISSYSEVNNAVKNCKNIFVNSFTVPAGKTLQFNLNTGTSLTFQGTILFDYLEWEGPLVGVHGANIHVTGTPGHKFDGQGDRYWDRGGGGYGKKKPKFFKITATGGSTFTNINLLNCPVQCVSISSSKQLHLSGWNIDTSQGDITGLATNTDGFDLSRGDTITIENCIVKNQDDCVAVNSGKNYHFSKLTCSGSHGLSLSVGTSSSASSNYAENITFIDCSVSNSLNGIHVKTHSDAPGGYIKDVTYNNIQLSGLINYGVNVQQDYQGGSGTGQPSSNIPITNLNLKNVYGSVNSDAMSVYILCGDTGCHNFQWSGINISGGQKPNSCNFQPSGFNC